MAGAERLRDLVLVVREHEVAAATVDVEAVAEDLQRHRGALDVPARTARAPRRLPARLAGLRRLPHAKSTGLRLRSSTSTRARTFEELLEGAVRKHAVFGQRVDLEIVERMFNRGDLDFVDEAIASGAVDHQEPHGTDFGPHLKNVISTLRAAFPDLHFEIHDLICETDNGCLPLDDDRHPPRATPNRADGRLADRRRSRGGAAHALLPTARRRRRGAAG